MPDGSTPRERADIINNKLKLDFMGDFLGGFKFYVDILRNYASPEAASWDFSKQIDAWASERAAVIAPQSVNAFSALTFYAPKEVKPHLKFAPTVRGAKGRLVQQYWSMSFGINRDSKNKVAAWKVLNFLTGRFEQKNFAQTLFPTTSLKSVLEDPEVKAYYVGLTGQSNIMDIIKESIETADPFYCPYIVEASMIQTKMAEEFSAAVAGAKTAEQGVKNLQDFTKSVLGASGYPV